MEIVGMECCEGVHTIELWFSERRQRWMLERIAFDGGIIGPAFSALDEDEAGACLAEWLRTHDEAHLVGRVLRGDRPTSGERQDQRC